MMLAVTMACIVSSQAAVAVVVAAVIGGIVVTTAPIPVTARNTTVDGLSGGR